MMRIDPNTRAQQAPDTQQLDGSSTRTVPPAPAAAGSDTAKLSGDQVRVQALVAQVSRLPEVRQDKVDALGRAIHEGSYQVSPEDTAQAMLAEFAPQAVAA